jgi:hypothetical protein
VTCSFFCLTEGQADCGPISLARALTASYGACSPYPRYIIPVNLHFCHLVSPCPFRSYLSCPWADVRFKWCLCCGLKFHLQHMWTLTFFGKQSVDVGEVYLYINDITFCLPLKMQPLDRLPGIGTSVWFVPGLCCLLDVFDLQIEILVGRDKDRTTVVLVHLMERHDDASES